MIINIEAAQTFALPRWRELPSLPLYMDQVMLVLQDALGLFIGDKADLLVTPTMINSYVKQKIIAPPQSKKYGKTQLAMLVVVSLLKSVLSMADIMCVIGSIVALYGEEKAYNLFCDCFENVLHYAFDPSCPGTESIPRVGDPMLLIHAPVTAVVAKLLVQNGGMAQDAGGAESKEKREAPFPE